MADNPLLPPAVVALHAHREALDDLSRVCRLLARVFGNPATEALVARYDAAVARAANTRCAYHEALAAKRAAQALHATPGEG